MWIFILILCYTIIILYGRLLYSKRYIMKLETSYIRERQKEIDDVITMLKELNDYQNFEKSSRDTHTRRLIRNQIEKYESKKNDVSAGTDTSKKYKKKNFC